ncbi:hypothetical protein SAMN02745172_03045 [Pseudoxanthobacter soli DSM 19599]|uniref:Uncharacterized protein n=1 Tax=Pseudoxanthobacter soli DSM 19599 TaxID=1123029 RepID=A0A1M7ZNZ4_9HYPH|nr:hypothetical protein SAMN02745172_03045 [Pseudoxanthobacter soli DSM 19599]
MGSDGFRTPRFGMHPKHGFGDGAGGHLLVHVDREDRVDTRPQRRAEEEEEAEADSLPLSCGSLASVRLCLRERCGGGGIGALQGAIERAFGGFARR